MPAVLLLMLGALGLRLAAAWGGPDLWIDEANGVLIAGRPVREIPGLLRADSSPPLSYLLLHAWMALFGDSPFAVRSLSALWGALAAGATCLAGRRLIAPAPGLLAGLYVAVCPSAIFHASQARMYALLPLLAVGALFFFARFLQDAGRGRLAAAAACTALALWTHNMALFLLPAQVVLCLAAVSADAGTGRRDGRDPVEPARARARSGSSVRWRGVLAHFLLVGLAYAPWLPSLLRQARSADHYAWFDGFWSAWGSAGVAWRSLQSLAPGGEFIFYAPFGTGLWQGATAVGGALLATLGGVALWQRHRDLGPMGALWTPAGLLVPALGALLISVLWRPILVPGRVDQMILPFFALLVGAGLAAIHPRALRLGMVLLVVVMALVSSVRWQQRIAPGAGPGPLGAGHEGSRPGEGALAADLLESSRHGDLVLFTSLSRAPVEYALRRRGGDLTLLSYPRSTAGHLGNQNDAALLSDPVALGREIREIVLDLRALCPEGCRLFVVHVPAPVNAPLLKELRARAGIVPDGGLGRYRQTGTGLPLEVLIFQVRGPLAGERRSAATGPGTRARQPPPPCSSSQRSASMEAMQPEPAAVTAWR